jgi:hypothetical protein
MQLTTLTHFNAQSINIPNNTPTDNDGVALALLCNEKESEYLTYMLGYSLFSQLHTAYIDLETNETPLPKRWFDLVNGVEFTDSLGRLNQWLGFIKIGTSPIANYIYYHWQKNRVTQTTGTGEQASKLANNTAVSPDDKMINAWNDMVNWNTTLHDFLTQNKTIYPAYEPYLEANLLTYQNRLGI